MSGELTSAEARILKAHIETIGTTVVSGLQAVNAAIGENSEQIGRMAAEVSEIKGMLDGTHRQKGPNGKHHVPKHGHIPGTIVVAPPASERPSLPPQLADEEEAIVVTTTGNFKVDQEFLDRMGARLQKLEADRQASDLAKMKADAEAEGQAKLLKKQADAADRWKKNFELAWKAGAGAVALLGGSWAAFEWLVRHAH